MVALGEMFAAARKTDGSLEFAVPDEWLQGRTAYGGLTASAAYEAARLVEQELPPLRSAQVAFTGPLSGTAKVRATVLRRGRSSAFVEARVWSGDSIALTGTFLFLADRPSEVVLAAPAAPEVTDPDDAAPAMLKSKTAFMGQLEFRHALSETKLGEPELMRWVRVRERAGLDPVAELIAVADALPPAVTPILPRLAPLSSANWSFNLLGSVLPSRDGWFLLRSRADYAADGVTSQTMSVWNREGRDLMRGMQAVTIYA